MISIIHPSRGRPEKSYATINKFLGIPWGRLNGIELIVSLDEDDPKLGQYITAYHNYRCFVHKNKSAVDAINNAAKIATGDMFIVVSDDTEPCENWDEKLLSEVEGKTDWILKTQDGIQNYIITNPIMDRAYYNRTGYIYHPDFSHLFCDTYLTCVADITGRKLTSNLMFKHNHYSVNGTQPDELHKRNDATWKQGEDVFIRLMKQFSHEELRRIKDLPMRGWLRGKGIRI